MNMKLVGGRVAHDYTVRWGDQRNIQVAVGQTVLTVPEIANIAVPYPNVFRIMFAAFTRNAANLGVSFVLVLNVGVGSSQMQVDVPFPSNVFNSFELPAQTLIARIRSSAALAVDNWTLEAYAAPLIPLRDLEVTVTGVRR